MAPDEVKVLISSNHSAAPTVGRGGGYIQAGMSRRWKITLEDILEAKKENIELKSKRPGLCVRREESA